LHMHVFPRYKDDNLYLMHGQMKFATPEA